MSTLNRDSAVIGRIENDNSICQAMRASKEHARLCAADCSNVNRDASEPGKPHGFICHAGLHCFSVPISINDKQLMVIGGKAFTSAAEYSAFQVRYGELEAIRTGEGLKNVKFVDARELKESANLVASTAAYHLHNVPQVERRARPEPQASPDLLDAHLEIIRLADQVEINKRSLTQFSDFLRTVSSSLESARVYQAMLQKFSEIMQSERSSLLILNEQSNELTLEAAVGAQIQSAGPVRLKPGEGIAGSVFATGTPLFVRDMDCDTRISSDRRSHYKTRSFISFPITLGQRKVGVINLTDRVGGSPFESQDLSLLEILAPHLALVIDRTEWHRKAEAFQRMSLTDPLTGLPNRRYLEDRLFEEVERSKRHDTPLAFMIIDVDDFKSYNDIYGHTNADLVLIKVGQILRRYIRAIDMATRYAGDEFCVMLPETSLSDAAVIAERLRKAASEASFHSEQGESMGRVTISIGVSSFSPSRQSPLSIVETADRALYQAKTKGRNCFAIYEDAMALS